MLPSEMVESYGLGSLQGDADACYEIQTEADVEYVTGEVDPNAAAEADAPKDNGEVLSTGLWQKSFV